MDIIALQHEDPIKPTPLHVGWKEWCALPELNVPLIKAKIDTGARTSSLHTLQLDPYKKNNKNYVRFIVDPLQNNPKIYKECHAEIIDFRHIKNSGGHIEERIVIHTPLRMGNQEWPIEITLTNRNSMRFRMLIGRQALKSHLLINPSKAYILKKYSRKSALCYYESQ